MRELMKLFGTPETTDDLGIGQLRDAISLRGLRRAKRARRRLNQLSDPICGVGTDYCATAAAVANTSAGIGRCSFQVIAIGFSPACCT